MQSAERERRGGGHGLGIAGLGSPRGGAESGYGLTATRGAAPRVTATTNLATCRNPDPVNVRCIRVYGLQKFVRPDRTPKRNFDFRVTGPTRGSPSPRALPCGRAAACAALSTQSSPQATSGAPIHQRGVPVPTARYSHTARITSERPHPPRRLLLTPQG